MKNARGWAKVCMGFEAACRAKIGMISGAVFQRA